MRDRALLWTTEQVDRRRLQRDGYRIFHFAEVRNQFIEPARAVGVRRTGLEPPASTWIKELTEASKVAVLGVPVNTIGDLRDLYGFILEPGFRHDLTLLLQADRSPEQLVPSAFIDPEFRFPWTLERTRFLLQVWRVVEGLDSGLPLTPIEVALLDAMKREGLSPHAQYGLSGRWRADFAFPDARLTVECDGRGWHDEARDRQRDAHLGERGWEVMRFAGSEIFRDAAGVARTVKSRYEELATQLTYTDLAADAKVEQASWWRRLIAWFRRRSFKTEPEITVDSPPRSWAAAYDAELATATMAKDGAVQLLAPAGSGKTTALVARVRELLARGVPANRILCTTFNRAAAEEIKGRLRSSGVPLDGDGVEVRSFHSVGYLILRKEDRLRKDVRQNTYAQWRRLAKVAKDKTSDGVWFDAPVAQDLVSQYKLGDMLDPAEAGRRARTVEERTAATLYGLYERDLEDRGVLDFDDLVLRATQLLQRDEQCRGRWQRRWEWVLVDEYQDIEPAQELLVRTLAAPEDRLFIVGDEDQCIYTWRRASVERIVDFDHGYPGLERFVLTKNHRCPHDVVLASAALIENNVRRFPKMILPVATEEGGIEVESFRGADDMLERCADLLEHANKGDVVVLARTTRLLRSVALSCAGRGIQFRAPDAVVRPAAGGAPAALLAYVRVLADPALATDDDLQTVFRIPNRYLPDASGARFAEALHSGNSFELAARSLGLEDWRSQHVVNGAAILDRARSSGDAPDALRLLRTVGGLDRHYADQELMSPHDQSDFEVLEAAERAANGLTLTNYAARLEGEARLLEESQSEDGVELATIHGSKGREWPVVILFGVDDGQLPHARSMTSDSRRSGSASNLEDERRLAYVALTRTQRLLIVMHLVESPSLFIGEAGLFSRDPVCGKPVTDPYGDRMTYVGGRAFYFCSNQCKLEFDRDPQRLSRSTLVGARLDQPKTAAAGG